jgi:hypothetical protein
VDDSKLCGLHLTRARAPQVCDALEEQLSAGGNVVDYHSCGFFPERCVAASQEGALEAGSESDPRCLQVV